MTATCGPAPLPGAPAGGWHRRVWALPSPANKTTETYRWLKNRPMAESRPMPDHIPPVRFDSTTFRCGSSLTDATANQPQTWPKSQPPMLPRHLESYAQLPQVSNNTLNLQEWIFPHSPGFNHRPNPKSFTPDRLRRWPIRSCPANTPGLQYVDRPWGLVQW